MKAIVEIRGVHGPYSIKAVNDFIAAELKKVEQKRHQNDMVGLVDIALETREDLLRSAIFTGDGTVVEFSTTGDSDAVEESAYYLSYVAKQSQFAARERLAA